MQNFSCTRKQEKTITIFCIDRLKIEYCLIYLKMMLSKELFDLVHEDMGLHIVEEVILSFWNGSYLEISDANNGKQLFYDSIHAIMGQNYKQLTSDEKISSVIKEFRDKFIDKYMADLDKYIGVDLINIKFTPKN